MRVLPMLMLPVDSRREGARERARLRERGERSRHTGEGEDSEWRCDSAQLIALSSPGVLELVEVVLLAPVTSASLFKLIG